MLKNRTLPIFATVAMLGLAACGAEEEPEVVVEETPAVDATVPVVEPVTPPVTDTVAAPMGTDTMAMPMEGTEPATQP